MNRNIKKTPKSKFCLRRTKKSGDGSIKFSDSHGKKTLSLQSDHIIGSEENKTIETSKTLVDWERLFDADSSYASNNSNNNDDRMLEFEEEKENHNNQHNNNNDNNDDKDNNSDSNSNSDCESDQDLESYSESYPDSGSNSDSSEYSLSSYAYGGILSFMLKGCIYNSMYKSNPTLIQSHNCGITLSEVNTVLKIWCFPYQNYIFVSPLKWITTQLKAMLTKLQITCADMYITQIKSYTPGIYSIEVRVALEKKFDIKEFSDLFDKPKIKFKQSSHIEYNDRLIEYFQTQNDKAKHDRVGSNVRGGEIILFNGILNSRHCECEKFE